MIYAKQTFGSSYSVVEYLGRYSHRLAIFNARILKVTYTHVTLRWCNRKENYKTQTQIITGVEFLKRFIEHIVPPQFRRIRHLFFLSSKNKIKSLELLHNDLNVSVCAIRLCKAKVLELKFGKLSLLICKDYGGELVLILSLPCKPTPPRC
ncbi:transposase [Plebeiibacterium sediminum]|uniref:Transposase n=1 Tax=Plebeiibacterium sediminum TaxID=2992112 RepID=A0AAE3SHC2_9BACT|nr:transposase [Plebeiobacterium sediminum]